MTKQKKKLLIWMTFLAILVISSFSLLCLVLLHGKTPK